MYLLYLDDSGSVNNTTDKHIILAGISVFERQTYWLGNKMDDLARQAWPDSPDSLEFRGSDIFSGRKHWRGIGRLERIRILSEALHALAANKTTRLFAAIVHREAVSPDDPMEHAFEQLCNRFDRMLHRMHKSNDTQRGLIILDESSYETSLQRLAIDFRKDGHRWGRLRNIPEVPLFVNSKATRMIQYADIVAYAVRRYYEHGDAQFFDVIAARFDQQGGVVHGMAHVIPKGQQCHCLACRNRPGV